MLAKFGQIIIFFVVRTLHHYGLRYKNYMKFIELRILFALYLMLMISIIIFLYILLIYKFWLMFCSASGIMSIWETREVILTYQTITTDWYIYVLYWKCNFPVNSNFHLLVGWFVGWSGIISYTFMQLFLINYKQRGELCARCLNWFRLNPIYWM